MALSITSNSYSNTSGADGGFLTNQNIMTLAGLTAGAMTAGGAAFVAAAVVPGHIVSGTIVTAGLLTGGHLKKTTGSYLPFLSKKDETPTPVTPITAVA